MRHISKSPVEPDFFSSWKAKANANWQPSFREMAREVKQELKKFLIKEQLGLCCYCEARVTEKDSHIEHFRPQTKYQDKALDYNNLLCSCQSNLKKGEPRHCGNAKDDWFDEDLLISPLSPDCAEHFRYTGDGHIYPLDDADAAAKETIAHLKLDISLLVANRRSVLDTFLDDSITDEEFKDFYHKYFDKLSCQNPPEFISAVNDVFSQKNK